MSSSNSTGLSAASTAKLRKDLTTLAHNRVFPVVVETALYGTRLRRGVLTVSRTPSPGTLAIFTVLIIASTYLIW